MDSRIRKTCWLISVLWFKNFTWKQKLKQYPLDECANSPYVFQKLLWWKKEEDSWLLHIISQADLAVCWTLSLLHFNKSLLSYLVFASLISVPWGNQDPVLDLARLYCPDVNGIFLVMYIRLTILTSNVSTHQDLEGKAASPWSSKNTESEKCW